MLYFLQKVICQLASWVRIVSLSQLDTSLMLSAVTSYIVLVVCARLGCARCLTTPALLSKMLESLPSLGTGAALILPLQSRNTPIEHESQTPGWPTWTWISFCHVHLALSICLRMHRLFTCLQTDFPDLVYASSSEVIPRSLRASWEAVVSPNWLCFLLTLQTKEDQMQVIGNLKNISMASSKLLLAAKSLSVDPGAPNAKNLLAAAARYELMCFVGV